MINTYHDFIARKKRVMQPMGFEPKALSKSLFPWQKQIVDWAVRRGRAALFEECGLGKTLQQLAWAEQVYKHTRTPVVIHTPVGVRQQTKREAEKFGIKCKVAVVNDQDAVIDGINLINYEKLHLFDASKFGGVVLDESSILKSFTGSTKRELCEAYKNTPFRLACTATPSPNDLMELGNHSDFLGVMPSNEMLSRWFINDTMKAGGYRLRMHARKDFWKWVASWAVCISKPSDMGGDDTGYNLPELKIERVVVEADYTPSNGWLFARDSVSATNLHEVKRQSNDKRADEVLRLAKQHEGEPLLIWCETNYEADAILERIPEAVEVRGSDSESAKESKLRAFSDGNAQILITKPSLAGFGMNWQHCRTVIFSGQSFSFEKFYQAVRRCWRFGQTKPVTVYLVVAESEEAIGNAVAEKECKHRLMQSEMAEAMRSASLESVSDELEEAKYRADKAFLVPQWLRK